MMINYHEKRRDDIPECGDCDGDYCTMNCSGPLLGPDLKPCPFCGGTPSVEQLDPPEEWVIECNKCGASSAVVVAIKEPAIGHLQFLWNRRTKGGGR